MAETVGSLDTMPDDTQSEDDSEDWWCGVCGEVHSPDKDDVRIHSLREHSVDEQIDAAISHGPPADRD